MLCISDSGSLPPQPVYCARALAPRWELFHGAPSVPEVLSGDPEHPARGPARCPCWGLCTLRATECTCSVRGVVQEEGEAWERPKSVGGGEINRRGQMRTPAFVHPNSPSQQRSGRSLHQQPGCLPHTRQGTSSSPHWRKNIIRQWLITSWS